MYATPTSRVGIVGIGGLGHMAVSASFRLTHSASFRIQPLGSTTYRSG
jgi:D-arabinose 1-dehydrogenase-like Zn-dependent alcohol dehydrogenase